MKQFIVSILGTMLVAAFSLCAQGVDLSATGIRTKSFSSGEAGKLIVKVRLGDLVIHSWDRNEVSFDVEGVDDDHVNHIKMSKSGTLFRLEYEPKGNMRGKPQFVIRMPTKFDAELRTSQGDLRLAGSMNGRIEGSTSNGVLRVDDAAGVVELATSSGNVTIGDIKGSGRFSTSRGDMQIRAVDGELDARTSSGNIRIESVGKSLTAHTSGGNIAVGLVGRKATLSTAGGDIYVKRITGGAKLKTSGGDITLENASGDVEAISLGGDIRLGNITGLIRARTAEGFIKAVLIPKGTGEDSLMASRGDISLTIPENAKVTITAVIRTDGRQSHRRQKYEVLTDFRVDSIKKDDDDMLVETLSLNGGGERVYLETVNANIEIRKLQR